jgi:hypothetical protein
MQLDTLLSRPVKLPYLFYGPAHSGKATALSSALVRLGYRPITLQKHEFEHRLQSNTVHGRTAYIAKISSLQEQLPAQPGTLIVYCCVDPYAFASADQLRAKYTLVDLSKHFATREFDRCVGGQRDPARKPPWTALQWLRHSRSYAEQHAVVEASPELSTILYRNVEHCAGIADWSSAMDKLSLIDAEFPAYIDHTDAHRETLSALTLLPLVAGQLNYRSNGQNYYPKKPSHAAVEKYAALLHENPVAAEQPAKKPRTAPQCKSCKVPMKGHSCPNKKRK